MENQPLQPIGGDESTQVDGRGGTAVALVAGVVPVFTPVFAFLVATVSWILFALVLLVAPFFAGGVAGFVWRGRHRPTYAIYALIIGLLASVVMLALQADMLFNLALGFSMATLFFSGLLFGDLFEKRRRWRSQGGPTQQEKRELLSIRASGKLAELSGSNKLSPTTTLLIQALGPASVGLIGTIATALITVFLSEGG